MKKITQKEIETVKSELAAKRKEFEKLKFTSLEKKLKWIAKFFNSYVPELERRYMSEQELKNWEFLPNELRILFYMYFPEHGLNMANYSQQLAYQIAKDAMFEKQGGFVDRFAFSHNE